MRFRHGLILTATFCLSALVSMDANAYYAAMLGRFLTRDPAGEVGASDRFGSGLTSRFAPRDTRIDSYALSADDSGALPASGYGDSFNLYEYSRSAPTDYTDPSGLSSAGGDCGYYKGMCQNTSGWYNPCQKAYYCAAARAVCEMAGNGPWRDCVRTCLQCKDDAHGRNPVENQNPVFGLIMGCVIHGGGEAIDHAVCFAQCRWNSSSYSGKCPCGN
jgi:hypothetical protein